jgi:hypothetical protein
MARIALAQLVQGFSGLPAGVFQSRSGKAACAAAGRPRAGRKKTLSSAELHARLRPVYGLGTLTCVFGPQNRPSGAGGSSGKSTAPFSSPRSCHRAKSMTGAMPAVAGRSPHASDTRYGAFSWRGVTALGALGASGFGG